MIHRIRLIRSLLQNWSNVLGAVCRFSYFYHFQVINVRQYFLASVPHESWQFYQNQTEHRILSQTQISHPFLRYNFHEVEKILYKFLWWEYRIIHHSNTFIVHIRLDVDVHFQLAVHFSANSQKWFLFWLPKPLHHANHIASEIKSKLQQNQMQVMALVNNFNPTEQEFEENSHED